MSGKLLTTASTVTCMHGGPAKAKPSNTKVKAGGMPVIVETDVHLVTGCPFTVGPKYSPCVRITWSAGTRQVQVNGVAALIHTSIGKCFNAEGAPQGIARIVQTQGKVTAT